MNYVTLHVGGRTIYAVDNVTPAIGNYHEVHKLTKSIEEMEKAKSCPSHSKESLKILENRIQCAKRKLELLYVSQS